MAEYGRGNPLSLTFIPIYAILRGSEVSSCSSSLTVAISAHGHNTLGRYSPERQKQMKPTTAIGQAMEPSSDQKAPEGFRARLSRWADKFDNWVDNDLLVFKLGTPWELTKQVAVKFIAAVVALGLGYAILVLGLAM